ncbi:MAG: aminodeoxychorismate/anthranilate synthase component II, partial [Commensalibacter sp.]|nr:aminodeoxychorismate/anthranilate synthase component II [Commensalibacter sp.]
SLIIETESLPDDFNLTAFTDDHILMALQHKRFPLYGVQFHPESIASEQGHDLLKNFLFLSNEWNEKKSLKNRI